MDWIAESAFEPVLIASSVGLHVSGLDHTSFANYHAAPLSEPAVEDIHTVNGKIVSATINDRDLWPRVALDRLSLQFLG